MKNVKISYVEWLEEEKINEYLEMKADLRRKYGKES